MKTREDRDQWRVWRPLAVRVLAGTAGLVGPAASGVVNTRIDIQVSNDGTNWGNLAIYGRGQTWVYARILVSYTGTEAPVGLASMVFQPTVSNAVAADVVRPFISGGIGGNTTTPVGVISGPQVMDTTSFGRVSPWGRFATTSTSALHAFFHTNPTGDGANYLRIAQQQVTSWIGGVGNTTGASGVPISQFSDVGRTTIDPPFSADLNNIIVFKFGLILNSSLGRTDQLVVDLPTVGFGNRNTLTGEREVYWYASTSEATGSIRGTAIVNTARIVIEPAPWSAAAFGLWTLSLRRRR